ncbi:MAG: hypothetical protein AB9866_04635 [Syntrophobacteraceae bacterium]
MMLVERKERWGLTRWGWMLLFLVSALVLLAFVVNIHPFLSISRPLNARLLVVEEWVSLKAFDCAALEFKSKDYSTLVVLGDQRKWVVPILKRAGVPESKIEVIKFEPARKDRTYTSAVALKNWMKTRGILGQEVNVVTMGPHARRSWLLFQKAFGDESEIGIIACEDMDYDPDRWWQTSDGFKNTITETIAYIYARLLFFPAE